MSTEKSGPKSVLIRVVDDDEGIRRGLCRLLEAVGYETRSYASAGDFLLHDPSDAPGCVLLDVKMPGPSGLELQQALANRREPLPVVFLSGHGDIPTSVQALKAGAVDFLTKPVKRDTLLPAVEGALAQNAASRAEHEELRALQARYETLTLRERQVLAYVVAGKLNKQIAGEIGAAERTVKAHRAQVMEKMRVGSLFSGPGASRGSPLAAGPGIPASTPGPDQGLRAERVDALSAAADAGCSETGRGRSPGPLGSSQTGNIRPCLAGLLSALRPACEVTRHRNYPKRPAIEQGRVDWVSARAHVRCDGAADAREMRPWNRRCGSSPGMVSIARYAPKWVTADTDGLLTSRIMVRARVKEHLNSLKERFPDLLGPSDIQESVKRTTLFASSYRSKRGGPWWRYWSTTSTYDNFKSEVAAIKAHQGQPTSSRSTRFGR